MQERRSGGRYAVSFPVRVTWKSESGEKVADEGLSENIGQHGCLIYLPKQLPPVGGKVILTVTENPSDETTVTAEVIRVVRNAGHPQVALNLVDNLREWKKKVWEYAAEVANVGEEDSDDL
jgi:hypothetical protein